MSYSSDTFIGTYPKKMKFFKNNLPVNIFFTTNGTSPWGESFPPSILKPSPVPSLVKDMTCVGVFGVETSVVAIVISAKIYSYSYLI